jgi:hypothetical protein
MRSPVEVAVVTELCTAANELARQVQHGHPRLAIGAHERAGSARLAESSSHGCVERLHHYPGFRALSRVIRKPAPSTHHDHPARRAHGRDRHLKCRGAQFAASYLSLKAEWSLKVVN